MTDDLFDEFLGYDFVMGADVTKCPHCGKDVPCSLFFNDDEIECPECGKRIKKDGSN
ncbi:MAG: hypothetical protein KKC11_00550 [Candidatus Omnitrophica bacterium]|nr:hypothetical protein [Candidatus Omnitrophota bacterium]MBU0878268.1 hypothetical protein [Candidatus Omnitrophota bacterium]MBU1524703.1 hypothetical protein [Candidatus Omnitrophota bacterium]MBU1810294.1 hypothetical protein [Candidatus Omnitrophota bacterium]